tara:strand:- start:94 stop:1002 length:909 start_codon:yes stop_codon:yes gene_type:complete
MNWRDYETYITRHFQRLFPEATIEHDVKRKGLISRTQRQIDLLISSDLAGFRLEVIVDCKYFDRKVDVTVVEKFLSFLRDLKANKGVIVTNSGYSKAAYNRATYDTQDVELRIIDFSDLETFQGFMAIPYAGANCALVSAPPGWVVDMRIEPQVYLATLYPAGLSKDEAFHKDGFMYVTFSSKTTDSPDLSSLLTTQEHAILRHYDLPRFEYLETIKRPDCDVRLRVLEAKEMNNTVEHTLFLDFPDVIIFINLLSPTGQEADQLRKLEWLGEKLVKGRMILDAEGRPLSMIADQESEDQLQ